MTQFQYELTIECVKKCAPSFADEISQEILNMANMLASVQAENKTLLEQIDKAKAVQEAPKEESDDVEQIKMDDNLWSN